MVIYSWNINGYNTCNKYGSFSRILDEEPDFICLQEVKISDPHALFDIFTLAYEHYYNFSVNKGRNGVYIFSKSKPKNCITGVGYETFDQDGRFLCLEYDNFCIINLYMPHGGRDKKNLDYKLKSYYKVLEFLSSMDNKNIIIVGDFNIAHSNLDVERYNDNKNNIMFTEEERNLLTELTNLNFIDVYRLLNPDSKEYTWWPYAYNARERNVGWRIDYCFVTHSVENEVKDIKLLKELLGSDHCPIRIEINNI